MPILATIVVFEETINGTGTYESDPQYNQILGRADMFNAQVFAANTGGTSPTLSLTYWSSNDGKRWNNRQALLTNADISTAPYDSDTDSTTDLVNGTQGKFQLSLGGTNPNAHVRITVALRTN